jgi:urease accessory protein
VITATGPAPKVTSFHARAAVATELGAGGVTRLETMRSDPPLTLRQTGPGLVHLVSTGAGPVAGDHLELDLDVAASTSLEVRSVASTLVLPGPHPGDSLMVINARVGAGASLRFAPEPTVLAAGCSHRMVVRLSLAAGASAFWREEIVFGRYGERPGRCHSRFDAVVEGRPLLRQEFVVGDPSVDGSPAVYGDAQCVGSILIAGPLAVWDGEAAAIQDGAAVRDRRAIWDGEGSAVQAGGAVEDGEAPAVRGGGDGGVRGEGRRAVVGEGWAALPLAGPGLLVSAMAADAAELRRRLECVDRRCGRRAGAGSVSGPSTPIGEDLTAGADAP